jgi:hypothetical protein
VKSPAFVLEYCGPEAIRAAKEALDRPNGQRTEYNVDQAMYVCRLLLLAVDAMKPET